MYMYICIDIAVTNISFGAMKYTVMEGTGFVELVLIKTPGAIGTVSVNLNSTQGTAGLLPICT